MPNVTVLTVDDQPIFRRVARSLLAATLGFEQVGEAASGPEALRLAEELRPDLVLIDVRMPGMDGIETARRLGALDSHALVVLISIEDVAEFEAARVGAMPCVRKQDLSARTLRELWSAHHPRAP